jgi:hypothetical protein
MRLVVVLAACIIAFTLNVDQSKEECYSDDLLKGVGLF